MFQWMTDCSSQAHRHQNVPTNKMTCRKFQPMVNHFTGNNHFIHQTAPHNSKKRAQNGSSEQDKGWQLLSVDVPHRVSCCAVLRDVSLCYKDLVGKALEVLALCDTARLSSWVQMALQLIWTTSHSTMHSGIHSYLSRGNGGWHLQQP